MNLQSYLVLAVVLLLAAAALRRMLRHRGCGSCGGCSSAECCGSCRKELKRTSKSYMIIETVSKKETDRSRTGNRGCRGRKAADEESPGFTGQDAG